MKEANKITPNLSSKRTLKEKMIDLLNPRMTHHIGYCRKSVAPSFLEILQGEHLVLPHKLMEEIDFPQARVTPKEPRN